MNEELVRAGRITGIVPLHGPVRTGMVGYFTPDRCGAIVQQTWPVRLLCWTAIGTVIVGGRFNHVRHRSRPAVFNACLAGRHAKPNMRKCGRCGGSWRRWCVFPLQPGWSELPDG